MMLLKNVVPVACRSVSISELAFSPKMSMAYLRIQGRALKMEIRIRMFVNMPLAMTAECWAMR